jgi:hypothetical protein
VIERIAPRLKALEREIAGLKTEAGDSGGGAGRCRFDRLPSNLINIDNSEFSDSLECDEKVSDEDELQLPSGFIRLEVVADLGWMVCELIKQPDFTFTPMGGFRRSARATAGLRGRVLAESWTAESFLSAD